MWILIVLKLFTVKNCSNVNDIVGNYVDCSVKNIIKVTFYTLPLSLFFTVVFGLVICYLLSCCALQCIFYITVFTE